MPQTVTNKYGIVVNLPGSQETKPEQKIQSILEELGVSYQMGFAFDETGLRKRKFDAAIFRHTGDIAFLIEYDGAEHYDPEWYKSLGNRQCRNKVHVVRTHLADAEKCRIAAEKGISLLRLNALYDNCMKDVIISCLY